MKRTRSLSEFSRPSEFSPTLPYNVRHFLVILTCHYIFHSILGVFRCCARLDYCLFPIENHITCDFPGGSGLPVPPSGSALVSWSYSLVIRLFSFFLGVFRCCARLDFCLLYLGWVSMVRFRKKINCPASQG